MRANKITELKLYDCWNADIDKHILKLSEILSSGSRRQFYEYYCYKMAFMLRSSLKKAHRLHPPLDSPSKFKIYEEFYTYFQKHKILSTKIVSNPVESRKYTKDMKVYSLIRYKLYDLAWNDNLKRKAEEENQRIIRNIKEEIKKIMI